VATVRALETICDRFEAAWQSKQPPAIEDYLVDIALSERSRLLEELLAVELVYRCRAGERPTPGEYRDRFPDESASIEAVFAGRGSETDACAQTWEQDGGPDGSVPIIPGYTVIEELGRGGMGVVFKASAQQLNRLVALKMILAGDLASPEAGARFLKEAKAVAQLQHRRSCRSSGSATTTAGPISRWNTSTAEAWRTGLTAGRGGPPRRPG
jgi:serine/threonine-protein kinase